MNALLILSLVIPFVILMYPLISFIRYKYFSKPITKSENFVVPVSIIIACYNEEKYIRNKIESFLNDDEWIEGSEIIVVSTGSTDNTNRILNEFQDNPSINLIISEERISKIQAVNLAVTHAKHDLFVFSDCRQSMKKGSVKQMIHNFNDEQVGTVVAKLNDQDEHGKQSLFRAIINKLVYYDSQSGSGLNVHGALYAQRKSIFKEFPKDQLFDDLCVIISTLSQNKRLIQEPQAIIYDVNLHSYYGGERLERLTRGLLIFLTRQWSQLMKIKKWDLARFLTFKYAKLLLPFSFAVWFLFAALWIFEINDILLPAFLLLLIGTLFFYKKTRLLMILAFRINTHFFLAIVKFFFLKRQSIQWEKL